MHKLLSALSVTLYARAKVGLFDFSHGPSKNLEGMTYAAIPKAKKIMRKIMTRTWNMQISIALLFLSPYIPIAEPKMIIKSAAMSTPRMVLLYLVSFKKISLWVNPYMVMPVIPRPTSRMTKAPSPEMPLRQVIIIMNVV